MSTGRPLLLGNTEVYEGSWVPIKNPQGRIVARGLVTAVDEIEVVLRDAAEMEPDITLRVNMDSDVTVPLWPREGPPDGLPTLILAKASRVESSGSEVEIWVF